MKNKLTVEERLATRFLIDHDMFTKLTLVGGALEGYELIREGLRDRYPTYYARDYVPHLGRLLKCVSILSRDELFLQNTTPTEVEQDLSLIGRVLNMQQGTFVSNSRVAHVVNYPRTIFYSALWQFCKNSTSIVSREQGTLTITLQTIDEQIPENDLVYRSPETPLEGMFLVGTVQDNGLLGFPQGKPLPDYFILQLPITDDYKHFGLPFTALAAKATASHITAVSKPGDTTISFHYPIQNT